MNYKQDQKCYRKYNNEKNIDLYISPNEDYMIFRTYGRATGSGLYITFNNDDEWSVPVNMGKEINKTGDEFCPMVDPDGKYFFFSSDKPQMVNEKYKIANFDIYYMSADFIDELLFKYRDLL